MPCNPKSYPIEGRCISPQHIGRGLGLGDQRQVRHHHVSALYANGDHLMQAAVDLDTRSYRPRLPHEPYMSLISPDACAYSFMSLWFSTSGVATRHAVKHALSGNAQAPLITRRVHTQAWMSAALTLMPCHARRGFEAFADSPAAAITVLLAAVYNLQDVVKMLVLHGADCMDNEERKYILLMASVFGWAARPVCLEWMNQLVKAGASLDELVSSLFRN